MTDKQVRMTKEAANNLEELVALDKDKGGKTGKAIVSELITKAANRVFKKKGIKLDD